MATSSHLRRLNQRRIVSAMLRLKSASRAQLAKAAGMSQPTVGRIVEDLLSDSILAEARSELSPGEVAPLGRPSTPLVLNARKPRFVVIQLGVRQTRLSVVPVAIPERDAWDESFDTPDTPEAWGEALQQCWQRQAKRGIEAIVISLPGVVDETDRRVLLSPNLRWAEQADFPALLRPLGRAPVLLLQEIRALAMGQIATQPDWQDFLLVDFGNGVGAAAAVHGRVYQGPLALSGELGHTPVLGNTRPCGCGAIGCVETLVSRAGLTQSASDHGIGGTWPDFVAALHSVQGQSLPDWLCASLDAVATTIAGALNVMGLKRVVLTGSLLELPASVSDYLCGQIKSGAMWGRFGQIDCRTAPRHRVAGMVSAAIDRVLFAV